MIDERILKCEIRKSLAGGGRDARLGVWNAASPRGLGVVHCLLSATVAGKSVSGRKGVAVGRSHHQVYMAEATPTNNAPSAISNLFIFHFILLSSLVFYPLHAVRSPYD